MGLSCRALGGGIPGAAAMGIQVGSLMWLRTTVNFQVSGTMRTRHFMINVCTSKFFLVEKALVIHAT